MMNLSQVSIAVGTLTIVSRLPGLLAPAKFREHMLKFPRSLLWGRVLMGIAALIVWWVMYHAATEEWKWAQPFVLIGVPVAYWLVFQYPPHYLSLRAVAALSLMIAKLMVDAADRGSSARLVVTVLGYLWVVAAIWMASAPHHFRDIIGYFMANDQRCRLASSVGIAVGLMLVVLGAFVY